jgi:hypothetical protein
MAILLVFVISTGSQINNTFAKPVIPAKGGIHQRGEWIPASAGMTAITAVRLR